MRTAELAFAIEDFGHLVAYVETTGRRVTITDEGRPTSVLFPAAELVELNHWAQRPYGTLLPLPSATERFPCGPTQHGVYMQYVHAGGGRMTFTRDRVVVAELRPVDWLERLERRAGRDRSVN
ncbi:type II toxin-antitoxin system prevent-host-death family antitoxin [Streptomyces sp. NBC_00483]|uniref:type II toxin-antitoxin system prevent-host-death family antitoxin n=1 Tax=Streptomyces sp. NBC_00483 TaxID=2975756 RepID=UPI002E17FE8D